VPLRAKRILGSITAPHFSTGSTQSFATVC
jgi:hypothetical protein